MKKIITPIIMSVVALSPLAFTRVEVRSVSARETVQKAATLPTTIDLNDASEETIRSYYAGLNDLAESERQGTSLLKNLKPIIKKDQATFSYGSAATTPVWQAYEIVDRDWKLSPASEIEGYDKATNTITGYVYGKSNSDVGSNPYIHALYVNRDAENKTQAWGDHTQKNYGINQEHVWPKSLGFDDDSNPNGARGDLMHLWAGNGRVNGQYHNNYYYGYVDKDKAYKDAGNDYAYLSGNLKGFSKTFGGDVDVFEPQDSDKGDIARTIFYMAARYNYLSGADEDGIDSSNPNLTIENNITSWVKAGYTSSTTKVGSMGILQDLLEWNKLDPVDEFEVHRNNLLYKNFSFNRNPFIDFPEWADYIWGESKNGTYNDTPKGFANPKTDEISKSSSSSEEPSKGLDLKTIIIIVAASVVVLVVLIILFTCLGKRGKRKVKKVAKKQIKKTVKKSTKSKGKK